VLDKGKARERSRRWYAANKALADARTRQWQKNNPHKVKAAAAKWKSLNKAKTSQSHKKWRQANRAKYGLPEPTRPVPLVCECCGKPESFRNQELSLDHCHSSGVFRGWLCSRCNRGMGLLGDTYSEISKVMSYLARSEPQRHQDTVAKSWGREEIVYNREYCSKKLIYERKISSSLHYHQFKHETFVVLSGKFELELVGQMRTLKQMDYHVLPPFTPHRIRCVELGTILEASTHDDPADCIRLIPSET
jgi:quercetin dioxygenase-like cupin family protein